MKSVLTKSLMFASLVVLSACDKGGSGGTKQAQVPATTRIQAISDAATFCDLSNNTLVCTSKNYANQVCNTTVKNYSDTLSLCQQLVQTQNESMNCNVSSAINVVYNQYNCTTVLGQQNQNGNLNPFNPTAPTVNDPNLKTIKCEFEAVRNSQSGGFFRINRNVQTPKTTALLTFDGRNGQRFNLRNYFIFDIGNFGNINMNYIPAGIKGTADTISISNTGFKNQNGDKMTMSQSGFAGQAVNLETTSSDGQVRLTISCAGQGAQFRKNVISKSYSKFECRGTSSLYGSSRENIEISLPYNSSLLNNEISLASNLTAQISGDEAGKDNARIIFNAGGIGFDTSLVTSAYLKTSTKLSATDGFTTLDLTCGPQ